MQTIYDSKNEINEYEPKERKLGRANFNKYNRNFTLNNNNPKGSYKTNENNFNNKGYYNLIIGSIENKILQILKIVIMNIMEIKSIHIINIKIVQMKMKKINLIVPKCSVLKGSERFPPP